MNVKTVAVIGAGVMGHGIAHTYAQYGLDVVLVDTSLAILRESEKNITNELSMLQKEGLVAESLDTVLSRIRYSADLDKSVMDVDYVAEAISENIDLKKTVFKRLDEVCPEKTILASNTSFLPIRELAKATNRPERVIGAHWVNPPHIVPLVEVVPTSGTGDETINTVLDLHRYCRKVPVVLKRDTHGFMPRLLAVLQNEAIQCLEEGLASAEDIDKMVNFSFGFRLPTLGPLRSLDYWDLCLFKAATDFLVKEYNNEKYKSPKLLEKMIALGNISMVTGKGFYDYSDVDISELRQKRDMKYCKQLKMLQDVGAL